MKPCRRIGCLLAATMILVVGCSDDRAVDPSTQGAKANQVGQSLDPGAAARDLLVSAGWEVAPGEETAGAVAKCGAPAGIILDYSRTVLTGNIAHYKWHIRVGQGEYDVIGLHRVVRESRPGRPITTHANLFLQHGDYKSFEGCYLPGLVSPRLPDDNGFAVYLAQNDIDVWGIDQAWCLVPAEETDLSFMADWDMQRQVDDLLNAMTMARTARRLAGSGNQPMLLSGYSTGGPIGFAALNHETQLPPGRRQIGGFIPVDQGLKTDVAAWAEVCRGVCANYQALFDAGQYQDNNPLPLVGGLALEDPDGDSPLVPGVTNLQAALIIGTMPFFAGVNSHFCAGIFDENGLPTGMKFVDTDVLIDFLVYAPPYEPVAYLRDEYLPSYTDESPYDDHLGEVTAPILYVMARGGFGYTGTYTLDLLGSTDVTIQEHWWGVEDQLLEYGHVDLYLDRDAASRVWQPIVGWVRDHSGPGGHGGVSVSQN